MIDVTYANIKQKKKQTKKSLKFFKMKRAAMHSKSLFVV